MLIVMDSGYDVTRLAFLLADLPVVPIGRLRSDRVLARPVAPRRPDARGHRRGRYNARSMNACRRPEA